MELFFILEVNWNVPVVQPNTVKCCFLSDASMCNDSIFFLFWSSSLSLSLYWHDRNWFKDCVTSWWHLKLSQMNCNSMDETWIDFNLIYCSGSRLWVCKLFIKTSVENTKSAMKIKPSFKLIASNVVADVKLYTDRMITKESSWYYNQLKQRKMKEIKICLYHFANVIECR